MPVLCCVILSLVAGAQEGVVMKNEELLERLKQLEENQEILSEHVSQSFVDLGEEVEALRREVEKLKNR